MIEGVVGYPGTGKTYYALDRAMKEMAKGRPVYANFAIEGAKSITPQSMFDVEPGAVIILDEAQNWFGSRNWREFGNAYMEFFSQTRKKEYTLIWLSQDVSSVDKTIRDRTNIIHRMDSWWGALFGHPLFFTVKTYNGAKNVDKEKFLATTSWIWFKMSVAESYDTHEIVGTRLVDGIRP
ncbi:MAG: zonular occludens toxin domain-containing protein [Candidatus Planktophila sp.]|nr:zonular occludens toxin domain-containing protein [Candidatus Planktophila sp.]